MKVDERTILPSATPIKAEGTEAAADNSRKLATVSGQAAENGDRVKLSLTNERVDRVTASLDQIPDVRRDKVADIKSRIEAGTYHVDARDVAEKMIAAMTRRKQ